MTTPTLQKSQADSAACHYTTAGQALVCFGGFCLLLAVVFTHGLQLELKYMDGEAMMATSTILVFLGAWMMLQGKRLKESRDDVMKSA